MKQKLRFLTICVLFSGLTGYTQNYTGYFRTPQGNTDYHHFTRNNSGAPVYINQEGTGPILRLSSGTYTANQGVRFTVENDGKVGIGTVTPTAKLHVDSEGTMGSKWNPSKSYLTIGNSLLIDPNEIYSEGTLHIGTKTGDILRIRSVSETGFSDKVIVKSNGNVGIGTMSPDSPLAVNGVIHSKEVRVDLEGWSDFVFEEDYDLPTLEEVEAHIKEKGHLKDIPGAREVKENGVLLGEMDAKLLQKIEELTLYAIQQQKMMDIQQKQIETILEENQQLRKEIDALKKP